MAHQVVAAVIQFIICTCDNQITYRPAPYMLSILEMKLIIASSLIAFVLGIQSTPGQAGVDLRSTCTPHVGEETTSGCTTIDDQKIYALPDYATYEWLGLAQLYFSLLLTTSTYLGGILTWCQRHPRMSPWRWSFINLRSRAGPVRCS